MNNDYKSQLQEREFSALKDKHRVILKWATGCGKSKMVIDLINNIHLSPMNILFLVAERAHIQNWQDEFDKWHLNGNRGRVDVVCYASLRKYKNEYYDVIVMDEAHHIFSEKRMAMLQEIPKNKDQYVYLLSATLSSAKVDMIEEIFGKFTISTVTLKEAIRKDILPDPRVYIIGMDLDNTVPNQTIQIGKDPNAPIVKWEDRGKYLVKNIPCVIHCTERQKYIYLTDSMEYWKRRYEHSHNQFQYNKWVSTGSVRKRYIGELKTEAVRNLINSFPKRRRFVCFCASVAQANSLSYKCTISSKKGGNRNQSIIDEFNNKTTNRIYAVGMITEGMNLTDIETGIIVQLDGKERLFIQKFGRSLRAEDPVSYIFYYRNTQDEIYLNKALENIDEKYIRHISIDQLKERRFL